MYIYVHWCTILMSSCFVILFYLVYVAYYDALCSLVIYIDIYVCVWCSHCVFIYIAFAASNFGYYYHCLLALLLAILFSLLFAMSY